MFTWNGGQIKTSYQLIEECEILFIFDILKLAKFPVFFASIFQQILNLQY